MILNESTKRNLCLLPAVLALAYVLGVQACRSNRAPVPVNAAEMPANDPASTAVPGPVGQPTPRVDEDQ